jgi:hypothetical protein
VDRNLPFAELLLECRLREADDAMRKVMAGIKVPVARQAIRFLEEAKSPWLARITRQRGKHTERLFWQYGGGYDRNITGGKTLLRMVDYLHNNPVRRGLVERAADWKWSSAAAFEGEHSKAAIAQSQLIRSPGTGWPTLRAVCVARNKKTPTRQWWAWQGSYQFNLVVADLQPDG